ncbi:glycosyltransferase [Vibrio rhizosphaerae]|uniref:Glycosyltransferase n=1 Tax=Vibrio rhizosphaerae TaxID=398736 RepID=A0ABU4ITP5_9VIBR|nr:glycosyltransferase [Vibrio rhizosphaerae]MDW6091563.1 glycosyltransferase [Vibrio rhizosphaerae]
MRIIIDCQCLQTPSKYRGIGHYTYSLIKRLLNKLSEHDVFILINGTDSTSVQEVVRKLNGLINPQKIKVFYPLVDIAEVIGSNFPRIEASEAIRNHYIESLAPDFVLITSLIEGGVTDFTCSIPVDRTYQVGVIGYDLIPYKNREKYLRHKNSESWYDRKIKQYSNADFIFSISDYVRNDYINLLNIDENKIINISSACSEEYVPLGDSFVKNVISELGITNEFVLYSGAADERKNLKKLISAFSKLENNIDLVLVGRYSKFEISDLKSYCNTIKLDIKRVVFTGYLSNQELACLYNACKAFVFPSLEEGFGLPVLEALSCGAPVICSNTSSLPEVIGNIEAMFDPNSEEDILIKLKKCIDDSEYRSLLISNAYEQSQKFSWDITSCKLIENIFLIKENKYNEKEFSYDELINRISDIYIENKLDDDFLKEASISISLNIESLKSEKILSYKSWMIEGPFDSTYSLALVNREFSRALGQIGQSVLLNSKDGPGTIVPNESFLNDNPDIREFYFNFINNQLSVPDICSRNLYPPIVNNMEGKINTLHCYAWEESGFPYSWVKDFNEKLNGITCLSEHVKKILIGNGVNIPLYTVGCGVDHWERFDSSNKYKKNSHYNKIFRFLHVSSCFPRKGILELLDSYGMSFSKEDNVELVIKTFDNPHNEVSSILDSMRRKYDNYPKVELIYDDISDQDLKSLYESSDVLVAPSKAEGFGLPLAEAMLSGIPVITTAWGGQTEFCKKEFCWLVDYSFERAKTHFGIFNSVWAVPNIEHLSICMKAAFQSSSSQRKIMANAGREFLLNNFRWSHVATNAVTSIDKIADQKKITGTKVGWITTWNTKCGIASYSKNIIEKLTYNPMIFSNITDESTNDDSSVIRCWRFEESYFYHLYKSIRDNHIQSVVIQFNYGFFDFLSFDKFIDTLISNGISITMIMHSTVDPEHVEGKNISKLSDALIKCSAILVHSPEDMNRLKLIGVIDNVILFPHAVPMRPIKLKNSKIKNTNDKFTMSSYGFFLPHKGLLELIHAVRILLDRGINVQLLMVNSEYPVEESKLSIKAAMELIESLNLVDNVKLYTDYLSNDDSISLLQSSDLVVFPYQNTGESSSAAVRTAISSGVDVAVTPIPIFSDVLPAVFELSGVTPQEIADSVSELISERLNNSQSIVLKDKMREVWIAEHDVSSIALRLESIINQNAIL